MSKITFADKADGQISAAPVTQKVSAADMNELKNAINALYDVPGFEVVQDDATPDQTFNNTPSKLECDAGGASTNRDYQPLEIRADENVNLWDEVGNNITPINIGDEYDVRVTLSVSGKTSNPSNLQVQLDIGGGVSPANVIYSDFVAISNVSFPAVISFSFPVYALANFVNNGGQIFLSTNSGSITVDGVSIYIRRLNSDLA